MGVIDWAIASSGQILTTIGLLFDIVGAFFVASEVVRQFRGQKFRDARALTENGTAVFGARGEETREFQVWETLKYRRMKWGLGLLVAGFLLQAVGAWMR